MKILVTGGAGYIGSHMVLRLLQDGHEPIVLDHFRYATHQNLDAIKRITGKDFEIITRDVRDDLSDLKDKGIEGIAHFAALKAVGKSVEKPLECYDNNVGGTINLLKFAREAGIKKFIFSSTAAVYGNNETNPITEDFPTKPASPYAYSKLFVEQIIRDEAKAFGLNAVILRYFNVVGCVESGEIGDPQINVQNLVPSMILSHLKIRPSNMKVFGTDYPTRDGTGVRDYIHVLDLIEGHMLALKYLESNTGVELFNLGTNSGTSVMEIINAFEKVTNDKLSYEIAERREGDVIEQACDFSKANKVLGWNPKFDIEDGISSMWLWYTRYFKKPE